jgi:hypothetical protein
MRAQNTVAAFVLMAFSTLAVASPCTEGTNSAHTLVKKCSIQNASDTVSGAPLKNVDVCISVIEKSGGPFGGDLIPWFFTHFVVTKESGEKVTYEFNNPDGRHNFRSLQDYTALDFFENEFYLESHRVVYPSGSRKGNIELHTIDFNMNSNSLTFEYTKKNGVLFGAWQKQMAFAGSCL